MKPQNIARLVELGSHDIAFTGRDWVVETGARVEEIMDLGFDPVRLVAAVPCTTDPDGLHGRRIVVASEYERISRAFLEERGYDYLFIRTHGATEAYPPQDADMIIDNTSTGHTLHEHGLKILAEIMASSTLFIAGAAALDDPWKRDRIDELRTLFTAVLNARERVMLEMNVPPDKLEEIVRIRHPRIRIPEGDPVNAVRTAVRGLSEYAVEQDAARAKLNQNESASDVPRFFKEAVLDRLRRTAWNRYPMQEADGLVRALARYTGHPEAGIMVSNGSNEAIQVLASAVCRRGAAVLTVEPGFAVYSRTAVLAVARHIQTALNPALDFDVEAVLRNAAAARLVFIASPHNPTGAVFPREAVTPLCRAAGAKGGLVVLARAEGLEGHAVSVETRLSTGMAEAG